MLSVGLGLEVFVSVTAGGNNHPHFVAVDGNKETPFPGFDSRDGVFLAHFPVGSVSVDSPDAFDALVGVLAVSLVDASDLMVLGHVFGFLTMGGSQD
jgi:hypothetical protein